MPSRRLGRRITLAFTAFSLTLTLILGIGVVAALRSIESQMLDETLRAEVTHFRLGQQSASTLAAFNSRTTAIHVATLSDEAHLPSYLRLLPEGAHDIVSDGHNYRVVVERIGNTRYIVQFDNTDIRNREKRFVNLVWVFSTAMFLIALFVGWILAQRVSAPLNRLAQDVTRLEQNPDQNIDVSCYDADEIGFLAGRLHHYHEQLGLLLAREREFAANVSHELRTPVTSIGLATEVLASNPTLSGKERERIGRIERATREMSELIDTFLVLAQARGNADAMHCACDVNAIVREVVEQQSIWLQNKPVEVKIDDRAGLFVRAPIRVVSVLIANLVRNAFRYTERGNVTITIYGNRLTVADTGLGIDSSTLGKLFQRHVRARPGDPEGAGLGLAIVQRICERYGWKTTVTAQEGGGSCFVVMF